MKLYLNNRAHYIANLSDWVDKAGLNPYTQQERIVTGYAKYLFREAVKDLKNKSATIKEKRLKKNRKRWAAMRFILYCEKYNIPTNYGYVYIISNPAFPNWYKVGAAKDAEARLNTYQTYSPFRDYVLEWYIPCKDYKNIEKQFHTDSVFKHEWVSLPIEDIKKRILRR